jgi:DNA repair photolyase
MSVQVGSQVVICDLPVHFDTYKGCTHGCEYCFTLRKYNNRAFEEKNVLTSVRNFIKGKRNILTNWIDWPIPLHWGAMSDPFQPLEKTHKASLKVLEILAETKYPFVVSTKNTPLLLEEPYASLLKECNVALQVSMVCPDYDPIEPGTPKFRERLKDLPALNKLVKRLIVRSQPYVLGAHMQIAKFIPQYRDAGVYGIILEGMKRIKKSPGFEKLGGEMVYPANSLRAEFSYLKELCHATKLVFLCGENRLRWMSDSPTCCGVSGMEGFRPNVANMNRLHECNYSDAMRKCGTAQCFKAMDQSTVSTKVFKTASYEKMMETAKKTKTYRAMMGLDD